MFPTLVISLMGVHRLRAPVVVSVGENVFPSGMAVLVIKTMMPCHLMGGAT